MSLRLIRSRHPSDETKKSTKPKETSNPSIASLRTFRKEFKLSAETLLNVLIPWLSDVSIFKYYRRLNELSQVSYGWAAMVNYSPSMWSRFSNAFPLATLVRVLNKLKEFPLEVELFISSVAEDGSFECAFGVGNRWRSLTFRLEMLFPQRPGFKIDLFGGKADRLQHVDLGGIYLRDTGILSGLRTLILRYLGDGASSDEELIDLLHASLALVKLSLEKFACRLSINTALQGLVELSVLTDFTLRRIDAPTSHQLLTLVRMPKRTTFEMALDSTGDFFSGNLPAHPIHPLRKIMVAHLIVHGMLTPRVVARVVSLVDLPKLVLELTIAPLGSDEDIQLASVFPMLKSSFIQMNCDPRGGEELLRMVNRRKADKIGGLYNVQLLETLEAGVILWRDDEFEAESESKIEGVTSEDSFQT
ncbi:hypothetical protein FRB96_008097 [Tulasnella sp. 330]|nr:hypothetical protein FRB96_008097 [Tulasnella sp. 330]